jgi:Zn-dependent protease
VIHEFAHAMTADALGDRTARANGRLTVNPLAHLDLLGIIMIVIAGIGWARPVPINSNNFRRPRLSMILAVAAGPLSNLVIAIIAYAILVLAFPISASTSFGPMLLSVIGFVNVALFVLNILPIPPLDGSQILRNILPYRQAVAYSRFDAYGPFLLLLLFIIPQFSTRFFQPIVYALSYWIMSWF